MVLIDRGSVVSSAGEPEARAVTGEIGAGADVVRFPLLVEGGGTFADDF